MKKEIKALTIQFDREFMDNLKIYCIHNRVSIKDFVSNCIKLGLGEPVDRVVPKITGTDEYSKRLKLLYQDISLPGGKGVVHEPDFPMYKKDYEDVCEFARQRDKRVAKPPGFKDNIKDTPITYYCKYCDAKVEGPNFCGMCGEKIE